MSDVTKRWMDRLKQIKVNLDAVTDPVARLVLDLHDPVDLDSKWSVDSCSGCQQGCSCAYAPWPCWTVAEIAKHLEVDISGSSMSDHTQPRTTAEINDALGTPEPAFWEALRNVRGRTSTDFYARFDPEDRMKRGNTMYVSAAKAREFREQDHQARMEAVARPKQNAWWAAAIAAVPLMKSSIRNVHEIEETKHHGKMLGMTEAEVEEGLAKAYDDHLHSPNAIDWDAVRSSMTKQVVDRAGRE